MLRFPMPETNVKGPWSWGCPQGISVDAAPEPNADYQVADLGVTPPGPAGPDLTFSPDNWYFMK